MFPFPSSILSPLSTASGGQGLNCSPICAPANPGRHFRGALSALRTLSRRKSLWRTRDQQALSHALGFLLSRPGHSVRSRCLPPWSVCASREMGREQQPDASREMRREQHPDAYSLGAVGDLTYSAPLGCAGRRHRPAAHEVCRATRLCACTGTRRCLCGRAAREREKDANAQLCFFAFLPSPASRPPVTAGKQDRTPQLRHSCHSGAFSRKILLATGSWKQQGARAIRTHVRQCRQLSRCRFLVAREVSSLWFSGEPRRWHVRLCLFPHTNTHFDTDSWTVH